MGRIIASWAVRWTRRRRHHDFDAKAAAYDATSPTGPTRVRFDYDNMAVDLEQMVQRGHNFAIVDEVTDPHRRGANPLIISGPSNESTRLYTVRQHRPTLKRDDDYESTRKSERRSRPKTASPRSSVSWASRTL